VNNDHTLVVDKANDFHFAGAPWGRQEALFQLFPEGVGGT
jgi:hypothetical protein